MTDRTPYCHKIRYGITDAPVLTEDEMEGSYAPGVGIAPTLIELVYSAPRDGKPPSVSASVTGAWTRFGRREDDARDDQVTTHFKNGPDGWPEWLAAEARLHDPAPPPVPADVDLRTLIRGVVDRLAAHAKGFQDVLDESDRGPWGRLVCGDIDELRALLAVPPGPEVVAYRHPTKPRAYLCRQHGDGQPDLTPVEADDLEYGGGCDECDVDVLIPQQQAGEGR